MSCVRGREFRPRRRRKFPTAEAGTLWPRERQDLRTRRRRRTRGGPGSGRNGCGSRCAARRWGPEGCDPGRQLVVDARRHARQLGAGHQAIALHGSQRLGEDLGRHPADSRTQLAEAARPVRQHRHHQRGPAVDDVAQHGARRAGGREDVEVEDRGLRPITDWNGTALGALPRSSFFRSVCGWFHRTLHAHGVGTASRAGAASAPHTAGAALYCLSPLGHESPSS